MIPIPEVKEAIPPEQPLLTSNSQELRRGSVLYHQHCAQCHGGMARGFGVIPDLRFMTTQTQEIIHQIVLEGLYESKGMGRFDSNLAAEDVDRITGYILFRANADREKDLAEQAEQATGP